MHNNLLCVIIAVVSICVFAEKNLGFRDSGLCGNEVTWSYDGSTLTISGKGDMYNYNTTYGAPWLNGVFIIDELVIEAGVTSIGSSAFLDCDMKEVVIPFGVNSIGDSAFFGCTSLSNLSIPSSVKSIGESAFGGCKGLVELVFPFGLETIGASAFQSCSGLTHVSFPASLTRIEEQAFGSCKGLQNVAIPENVTFIGGEAFGSCASLSSIDVEEGNKMYKSVNGVLFDSTCRTLILFPPGKADVEYTIPSTVVEIEGSAFSGAKNLTNITIPDSVRSLGGHCFARTGLIEVFIPDTVTAMDNYIFKQCPNLVSFFYQGSTSVLRADFFPSCVALSNVCVSPDYQESRFAGKDVTSSSDTCDAFRKHFNHCFKGKYENGIFSEEKRSNTTEWEQHSNHCYNYFCLNETGAQIEKRSNATEWEERSDDCYEHFCLNDSGPQAVKRNDAIAWEEQSNNCYDYQCDNKSGFVHRSMCNSTSTIDRMCVNDQCIDGTDKTIDTWRVEIEMNISQTDLNITRMIEDIALLSGIEKDKLQIGTMNDGNGFIVKIALITGNQETANAILEAVNGINKGEGCEKVWCHARNAKLMGAQWVTLSYATGQMIDFICLLICFILATIEAK